MSGLWRPGDPIPEGQDLDDQFKGLGLDFEDEGGHGGDTGPSIRLLRCTQCKSLEILPDYVGDPRDDVVLDDLVLRHQQKHPYNDVPDAFLLRVSQQDWDRHKKTITKQIWSDVKTTGFIPEYYDTKSTYNEDAVKCFDQHRRSIPCIDWHSDRKRIGNPTKEGWKTGPKVYLCDFCPVAAKVQQARNKARGLE